MIAIPLRNRAGEVVATATVDDQDVRLAAHRWYLSNQGYVARGITSYGRASLRFLHREVLGLQPGDSSEADHRDRDPLNNVRSNLRVATRAENAQNLPSFGASRFRGVTWHRNRHRWEARGCLGRRRYSLGSFRSEVVAAATAAAWREEHMPFSMEAQDA